MPLRQVAALLSLCALLACGTPLPAPGSGPALWRIQDVRGSTVYLLGTQHLLSAPEPWFTPRIAQALAKSNNLWLEVTEGSFLPGMLSLPAPPFDAGYDLSAHLSAPVWAKLRPTLVACGIPERLVDHTRPWFAVWTILECQAAVAEAIAQKSAPLQTLAQMPDLFLSNLATTQGKSVGGLETLRDNYAAFADLPDSTLLAGFEVVSAKPASKPAITGTLSDAAWLHGDLDALERADITPLRTNQPAMYDALLSHRNVRFAQAIVGFIKSGQAAFVAIGVGHLIGPDSVLADLQGHGFSIARIE